MHPTIQQQKKLMEMSLAKLQDIQTIERLIEPVDPITAKVMTAELKNHYKDIMSELFANLLQVSAQTQSS